MKFKVETTEDTRRWAAGHIRILKFLSDKSSTPYVLQRSNGILWDTMGRFCTLAQAKAYAANQMIEVIIDGIPTTLDVKVAQTICDAFHASAQSCCKMEAEKYMKLHFTLWEALEAAGYHN